MSEQAGGSSYKKPHFTDFVNEAREFAESVIPPEEVRQHFRNSRIEFWKGVRALVDLRIEHLGRKGHQQKGAAVPVE